MKILHPAGKKILFYTLILLLTINTLSVLFFKKPLIYLPVLIASLIPAVLVFRFFRVPRRTFLQEEGTVVAPADGKIVVIERTFEEEFFGKEMIQVSIFMSIHNVHINWFPFRGKVTYFRYHPGKYLLARHPKSSRLNEHTSIVISGGNQSVLVRQIAGYVARRILTFTREGDEALYGREMGFIRFGSRLDLFLPTDAEILVVPGQRVSGGVSRIALLKK
ncbi:MAG: phosphatidylserine decarboxylase family protein [Bacteroidota bacterium]